MPRRGRDTSDPRGTGDPRDLRDPRDTPQGVTGGAHGSVHGGAHGSVQAFVRRHGLPALELEWRLGHSHEVRGQAQFRSGVDPAAFARLAARLDASPGFTKSYLETVELIGDGVKRIEPRAGFGTGEAFVAKRRVSDHDTLARTGPWTIRASVSYEAPVAPPPGFAARFQRVKRRASYRHACWSVDLTRASSNLPDQLDADAETCEVEVELADSGVLLERPLDNVMEWGESIAQDLCAIMGDGSA